MGIYQARDLLAQFFGLFIQGVNAIKHPRPFIRIKHTGTDLHVCQVLLKPRQFSLGSVKLQNRLFQLTANSAFLAVFTLPQITLHNRLKRALGHFWLLGVKTDFNHGGIAGSACLQTAAQQICIPVLITRIVLLCGRVLACTNPCEHIGNQMIVIFIIQRENTLSAQDGKGRRQCFFALDFGNCGFNFLGGDGGAITDNAISNQTFTNLPIVRETDFRNGSVTTIPIGDTDRQHDQNTDKNHKPNTTPLPDDMHQITQRWVKPAGSSAPIGSAILVLLIFHLGLASSSSAMPSGSS